VTHIVSVVDVFDALVSRRPYEEPRAPQRAAQELEKGSGTQFDPTVVTVFLTLFHAGTFDPVILAAQNEAVPPEDETPLAAG
jgi:HD-GYP domain-containing protein (c-di-GMP phosphodiesterase class II)